MLGAEQHIGPTRAATAKQGPIVIAHRGACGYLPEHTRAAKLLAYGMGADFLEQDVVASRDGRLIVAHDLWLEDTTDVALRYPSRSRNDGHFYVADFTLAELRQLRVKERRAAGSLRLRFENRFSITNMDFALMTLEDEIALIAELNRQTGRRVGIYPEVKAPQWHERQGFDLAGMVVDSLNQNVPDSSAMPVFVQCFDPATVRRLCQQARPDFGVVQLTEVSPSQDAHLDHGDPRLALGPAIDSLVDGEGELTKFAQRLGRLGLPIHCYTLRTDQLPKWAKSTRHLWQTLTSDVSVAGVFTDFPDVAIALRSMP